jgi:hypothetical protein
MSKQTPRQANESTDNNDAEKVRYCGIIMPIAAMPPEYDAMHWARVKEVISDAIAMADFTPRLVSEADDVGVIHGHIVQNLYDDEIVVCDVSGKNPNVMFELGLRLAFDKPTIIVQDDSNGYSFDIGPIKHIGYRRDQRYDDVLDFKDKVKTAINATLAKKRENNEFSPFLKHFGSFTPKKVEGHEVPQAEFIMQKLHNIEKRIRDFSNISERMIHELDSFGGGFLSSNKIISSEKMLGTEVQIRIREAISESISRVGVAIPEASAIAENRARKSIIQMFKGMPISEDSFKRIFRMVWSEMVPGG